MDKLISLLVVPIGILLTMGPLLFAWFKMSMNDKDKQNNRR